VSLAPGRHAATFLWQLFPSAPSGRAELRFTGGAVSVTALRYGSSGVFSAATVGVPGSVAGSVSALFSPGGGVRSRLVAEIGKAVSKIDLAIYSFTANELREALIAAKNRGVAIRIVADSSQADGLGGEVPTLESLGFTLKRCSGLGSGIMHDKYMIIDRRFLFTGSYNWSVSAEDSNFENAILIEGLPVIREYEADFDRLWNR
jgi:phosphatidylserine/phosphatidylglycerophosphate/cardiolipin synthase-like enzyme